MGQTYTAIPPSWVRTIIRLLGNLLLEGLKWTVGVGGAIVKLLAGVGLVLLLAGLVVAVMIAHSTLRGIG